MGWHIGIAVVLFGVREEALTYPKEPPAVALAAILALLLLHEPMRIELGCK